MQLRNSIYKNITLPMVYCSIEDRSAVKDEWVLTLKVIYNYDVKKCHVFLLGSVLRTFELHK